MLPRVREIELVEELKKALAEIKQATDSDDAEALRLATAHREAAFDELYGVYDRPLRGYIRMHSRTDEDAKEIKQNTWLAFWKYLPDYDPTLAPVMAFLRLLAARQAASYYNHLGLRRQFEITIEELRGLLNAAPDLNLDTLLDGFPALQSTVWAEADLSRVLHVSLNMSGRPPHEVIAFGYQKFLGWQAQDLVDELSPFKLAILVRDLKDDYCRSSRIPAGQVAVYFVTLEKDVKRMLAEWGGLKDIRENYGGATFYNSPATGEHELRAYYRNPIPAIDIKNWTEKIRRKTISLL